MGILGWTVQQLPLLYPLNFQTSTIQLLFAVNKRDSVGRICRLGSLTNMRKNNKGRSYFLLFSHEEGGGDTHFTTSMCRVRTQLCRRRGDISISKDINKISNLHNLVLTVFLHQVKACLVLFFQN